MGKKLDYDPATQTEQTFHYDHDKKEFTVQSKQNVESILRDAKKAYAVSKRSDKYSDMTHTGYIPNNINAQMMRENKGNPEGYQKALKKWTNDPDYRKFRTRPGKI